jgi:choline-sulfatase
VLVFLAACVAIGAIGCGGGPSSSSSGSRADGAGARPAAGGAGAGGAKATAVVLVTIDTLRADRVGAYGWRAARTPAIDALAARGVRFDRAYAAAPITLTSHASLLTGLNPPAHGARHNGMRLRADVPTLAEMLHAHGFATGAFVAAFPLERRFGLDRGFEVYGDALPRGPDGRQRNERPGHEVVDEALAWLAKRDASAPFFLWVHLFEPHAPYEGDPTRSASDRYDDEIAKADAQVARLVEAVKEREQKQARRTERQNTSTLIIIAGDHGEAFGEHGEIGHSVFVYDTTLRVPLVIAGLPAQMPVPRTIGDPVALVDVMPTILELTGLPKAQTAGISLVRALNGEAFGARLMYAESYAPLFDFGWSPLRSLRVDQAKYIAAPKPELYDIGHDAGETHNAIRQEPEAAKTMAASLDRMNAAGGLDPAAAPAAAPPAAAASAATQPADAEAQARLRSLGYLASSSAKSIGKGEDVARPDPKDRIALASRIAEVTSGELQGAALRAALERLVREDPKNGQMQMRLGFVLQEAGDCRAAVPHFEAAIKAAVPSADPQLGLAECFIASGQQAAARRALDAADHIEPGNPVVAANLGMLALDAGSVPEAIDRLRTAVDRAPDLHQARFALARAYGRAGRRSDAAREARELLNRLPPDAPQRAEVQRLLAAVQ